MTGSRLVVECSGLAATRALAGALAPLLRAGDALLLIGELGTGKTTFTQALAAAMGVRQAVTSPTFTLVCRYESSDGPAILHADLYRLDSLAEVAALGLAELVEENAVAVIEWGERSGGLVGPEHLEVAFEMGEQEEERRISLQPVGSSWEERWSEVVAALAPMPPGKR